MVPFELLLNMEKDPLTMMNPTSASLFKVRSGNKSKDGKVKYNVNPPSVVRETLFTKENIEMYENEYRNQIGARRTNWRRLNATRMRGACPPGTYKRTYDRMMGQLLPLSNDVFNAVMMRADHFRPEFRLDIVTGTMSFRTSVYDISDIVEKMLNDKHLRTLASTSTFYPTGLASHRKKEVEIHQQICYEFAQEVGMRIIDQHKDRPCRNPISLKHYQDLQEVQRSNPLEPSDDDKGQSCKNTLTTGFHQPVVVLNESVFKNPANNEAVKEGAVVQVPESKISGLEKPPKIAFLPRVDSYIVDGALHEGIAWYLNTLGSNVANPSQLSDLERMREVDKVLEDSDEEFGVVEGHSARADDEDDLGADLDLDSLLESRGLSD